MSVCRQFTKATGAADKCIYLIFIYFFHFHFIAALLIIYYCSLKNKNVYQLNDFIIITYENATTTTELAKGIAISVNKKIRKDVMENTSL